MLFYDGMLGKISIILFLYTYSMVINILSNNNCVILSLNVLSCPLTHMQFIQFQLKLFYMVLLLFNEIVKYVNNYVTTSTRKGGGLKKYQTRAFESCLLSGFSGNIEVNEKQYEITTMYTSHV